MQLTRLSSSFPSRHGQKLNNSRLDLLVIKTAKLTIDQDGEQFIVSFPRILGTKHLFFNKIVVKLNNMFPVERFTVNS